MIKMKYSTAQFAEFEKENNLFSLKYNNIPYWQLLRFTVSEKCLYSSDGVEEIYPKAAKSKFIKLFFCAFFASIVQNFKNINISKSDVLFFYTDDKRKLENELINPFFDLIDTENLSVQKLLDLQEFINIPQYAKNMNNISPAIFKGYLYKLFFRLFRKKIRDEKAYQELKNVIKSVNEKFSTNITKSDINALENEIIYLICAHKAFVPYFKKMLKKIKPKAIVVKCYYNVTTLMMIKSANELNIPIVELQHGHIYNHISYLFSDKSDEGKYVPDVLFAFNNFFANECVLCDKTKINITGYPFLEKSLELYKAEKLIEDEIVFYSQPSLGNKFVDFMLSFAQIAKEKNIKTICKLHPKECAHWREIYPDLKKAHSDNLIKIDDDKSANVYSYIAKYKFQIVADSTTAFEIAAVNGTKLFIPLMCPHSNTQPMLDLKLANGVESAKELLQNILQNDDKNKIEVITEEFWPKNSCELIKNALNEIVN